MKLFRFTALSALVAMFAISCQNSTPVELDPIDNQGYLKLSSLSVEVVTDHKKTEGEVSSRTEGQVDINTFDCFIYNESGDELVT